MIELPYKLQGEYKLTIARADGSVEDTGWFPNIVTDTGLDSIPRGSGLNYCGVGTSGATPSATDTTLGAQVGSRLYSGARTATNLGSPTYAGQCTITYAFAQGDIVGNLAEVGVSDGAATSLCSRALIVDASGNPTTISVVAMDQLTVSYRIRCYPVLTDSTGSVVISGTTYTYTARMGVVGAFAAAATEWGQSGSSLPGIFVRSGGATQWAVMPPTTALSSVTSQPSAGSLNVPFTSAAYVLGSNYIDHTLGASTTQGNCSGGIGLVRVTLGTSTVWQIKFGTPIPKDNTKTLTLTIRVPWARV